MYLLPFAKLQIIISSIMSSRDFELHFDCLIEITRKFARNVSYTCNQLFVHIFLNGFRWDKVSNHLASFFLLLFKCQWIYMFLFMNHIPPKHGQQLKSVYLYVPWCTCSLEKPDSSNNVHSSFNLVKDEDKRWRLSLFRIYLEFYLFS